MTRGQSLTMTCTTLRDCEYTHSFQLYRSVLIHLSITCGIYINVAIHDCESLEVSSWGFPLILASDVIAL